MRWVQAVGAALIVWCYVDAWRKHGFRGMFRDPAPGQREYRGWIVAMLVGAVLSLILVGDS